MNKNKYLGSNSRRRKLLAALDAGALAAPLISFAQQPGKVWRIGMLETTSMTQNAANLNAFRQGMRALGYVEGQNFVIEKLIAEYAAKHRLPTIYSASDYVDAGGLISYGVSYPDLYRRAATYTDKIFKGASRAIFR